MEGFQQTGSKQNVKLGVEYFKSKALFLFAILRIPRYRLLYNTYFPSAL
jgi:hypothetical protein